MPIIDHFGILAPLYDRIIHPPGNNNLANLIEYDSDTLLLDAGGGTGRISRPLADKIQHTVICDISRRMLAQAEAHPHYTPMQCDLENIPVAENQFNRIIIVDAVHHVVHPEKVLAELWRILTPGGRLIVEEPDIRHFQVKLVAIAEKITFFQSHFLTAAQIQTILQAYTDQVSILPDPPNVRIVAVKAA